MASETSSTVSVVIATYNGSKYIIEQLESIRQQSRQPDEVIIRDDCSTDDTVKLTESFIQDHCLTGWRVLVNNENKGWKENFHQLIMEARGDIIFLCDQDDVWLKEKTEIMIGLLEQNQKLELVASSYDHLIDGKVYKRQTKTTGLEYVPVKPGSFHLHHPGATFAVKRTLIEASLPYWDNEIPHDAILWNVAILRHSAGTYHEPLILYRRHENTATGRDELSRTVKKRNIELEKKIADMLLDIDRDNDYLDAEEKKIIHQTQRHIDCRKKIINDHSIIYAIKIIPTISYYTKKKTYLGDVLMMLKRD